MDFLPLVKVEGHDVNLKMRMIFLNHNLNLQNYTNNKGEPLTDIYIGIIKNGSLDLKSYKTVESHFSDFIDHVSVPL